MHRWGAPPAASTLDTLAGVVKLVYTQVLGTCAARREGSSPFSRTKVVASEIRLWALKWVKLRVYSYKVGYV
jgi:hypothetical protein